MKQIGQTSWPEIFKKWAQREARDPGWIDCATKIKGWPDWQSWRKYTATLIKAEQRTWGMFEITDPINEIPNMLIGPYSGWQSRVREKNKHTFSDLLDIPEQYEFWSKHDKVLDILNNLPFATEFIGLRREDSKKIVCLEGHHRAVAIALAKKQNIKIDFNHQLTIALADLKLNEIDLLNRVLKLGTTNPNKIKEEKKYE